MVVLVLTTLASLWEREILLVGVVTVGFGGVLAGSLVTVLVGVLGVLELISQI